MLHQSVLEEMAARDTELGRLRERAHGLWEGQAAGKGFLHRVSQLSAQYLALCNLTKVKKKNVGSLLAVFLVYFPSVKFCCTGVNLSLHSENGPRHTYEPYQHKKGHGLC